MERQYFEQLKQNYLAALNLKPSDAVRELNTEYFCGRYEPQPEWSVGPFRRDDRLTFRKQMPLGDPTGIGWTSSFLFNPSLLVQNDQLWLFYRAGVKKESLGSRIGLAVWDEKSGWREYPDPVIWPTEPNEVQSVEDPKVYRAEDGTFVMFYNGIYNASPQQAEKFGVEPGAVCVDLLMAVSDDLIHWEKRGSVCRTKFRAYGSKRRSFRAAATVRRSEQEKNTRCSSARAAAAGSISANRTTCCIGAFASRHI